MNRVMAGIVFGIFAGIIDMIPMIIQGLTWDANLSALTLWIVSGFLIATSNLKFNPILKGIIISFLILLPCSFIIGWHEPTSLIPIFIMTFILGSLLGFSIDRFSKTN
jgi:hypothetical protein